MLLEEKKGRNQMEEEDYGDCGEFCVSRPRVCVWVFK